MNLAGFLSVFWVISSVGAAKKEGEDDWVHLPNKCEGKLSVGVSSVRFSEEVRGPAGAQSRERAGDMDCNITVWWFRHGGLLDYSCSEATSTVYIHVNNIS